MVAVLQYRWDARQNSSVLVVSVLFAFEFRSFAASVQEEEMAVAGQSVVVVVRADAVGDVAVHDPGSSQGDGDDTAVEWWLMTSLPIESVADIERVIDYYKTWWTIEVYFKVLKTGCKVEDIQLETTARAKNDTGQKLSGHLPDHRVAGPVPDAPESRVPAAAVCSRIHRLRVAISLACHHETGPARQTPAAVEIRGPAGTPGRLQQPSHRTTSRPATHLGRPAKNVRLRPRLAFFGPPSQTYV